MLSQNTHMHISTHEEIIYDYYLQAIGCLESHKVLHKLVTTAVVLQKQVKIKPKAQLCIFLFQFFFQFCRNTFRDHHVRGTVLQQDMMNLK